MTEIENQIRKNWETWDQVNDIREMIFRETFGRNEMRLSLIVSERMYHALVRMRINRKLYSIADTVRARL